MNKSKGVTLVNLIFLKEKVVIELMKRIYTSNPFTFVHKKLIFGEICELSSVQILWVEISTIDSYYIKRGKAANLTKSVFFPDLFIR